MISFIGGPQRALGVAVLLLAAAVAMSAACGGGDAEELELTLPIKERKLDLDSNVIKVKQGDIVTLSFTTDEAGSVHLHVYDIEWDVTPDSSAKFVFTADATGGFPMTFHPSSSSDEHEGEEEHEEGEEVTLGALEVFPR